MTTSSKRYIVKTDGAAFLPWLVAQERKRLKIDKKRRQYMLYTSAFLKKGRAVSAEGFETMMYVREAA